MKKNKNNIKTEEELISRKAYFFQRLGAYIIDMFIISMIVSLITQPFIDFDKSEKLEKQATEIVEKYSKEKISLETYFYQSLDLSYQLAKNNGIFSFVSMVFVILYFIIYQFYNKGQTIGKKLMNIQIVKYDKTSITINDMIFRSLIINTLLFDMISFALMVFTTRDIYGYGTFFVQSIQIIILLIIVFMVLFRKDGRGLHDLIANTIVVKKDVVKEEECKA